MVRLLRIGVPIGILIALAGDGIRGYFAPDEMMNLYFAWFPPISKLVQSDRPIGALIYRAMFGAFGLNPLPYRCLCFALLLANLVLLYKFSQVVSGSDEVGAIACLIGAYHAHLADLYYTSSDLFDLLCFFFYFLCVVCYIRLRRGGREVRVRDVALLTALYVCALGSKEMAVTLPVILALYEIIYLPRKLSLAALMDRIRHGWFIIVWVLLAFLYLLSKTAGSQRMTINQSYLPHLSLFAFLGAWQAYLFDLFYRLVRLNHMAIVAMWILMLAFAAITRRRELHFAWWVAFIGAFPFIFIEPRGFYVMYMTLPGWCVYIAVLLVKMRDRAYRALRLGADGLGVRGKEAVLYLIVLAVLLPLHFHEKPIGKSWLAASFGQTRPVIQELTNRNAKLPHPARVLFLSDPCPVDDYLLYFIVALYYRDKDIIVDRAKVNPSLASVRQGYDYVFYVP